jgi:hypothetical protein
MGNGAKAASKRDRQKEAGPVAKSQLKSVRFFFPFCRNAPRPRGKRKQQSYFVLMPTVT